MYKFPDISRWFDIVDYVEYNNCRKIEINMKKYSVWKIWSHVDGLHTEGISAVIQESGAI